MFCPQCGNQMPDGAAFCPACGNAMKAAAPQHRRPANQPSPQTSGYAQPNAAAGVGAPAQPNAYSTPAPYAAATQSPAQAAPASYAAAPASTAAVPQRGRGFVNARRGLSTLLHAYVIVLVAAGITLVLGLAGFGAGSAGAGDLANGLIAGTGISAIITGVLTIVAYIMEFVGYYRASRDEKVFLWAFIAMFVNLGCAVLTAILYYTAISNFDYGMLDGIRAVGLIGQLASLVVCLLTFFGVSQLAKRVGRSDVATMALVMLAIAAACNLIVMFMPVTSAATYFLSLVASLVPTILLLVTIVKGRNMLA